MKEAANKATPASSSSPREEEFKGYTLNELRYQRALLLLKKEFLKEKATEQLKDVRENIPFLNGHSGISKISSKGVLGKVMKGLSFADYLMIGFSLFNSGRRFVSLFRKKKK